MSAILRKQKIYILTSMHIVSVLSTSIVCPWHCTGNSFDMNHFPPEHRAVSLHGSQRGRPCSIGTLAPPPLLLAPVPTICQDILNHVHTLKLVDRTEILGLMTMTTTISMDLVPKIILLASLACRGRADTHKSRPPPILVSGPHGTINV